MATIAVDCETVSLQDQTLVAITISDEKSDKIIPVRMNTTKNWDKDKVIEYMIELISNNKIVFHNSSFDIPVLVKYGIPLPCFNDIEDTLVLANLHDERIRHGLKSLTKRYLHRHPKSYKEVAGRGKKQVDFCDVEWELAKSYAIADSRNTFDLYNYLINHIDKDVYYKVYCKIERPLLIVVADMHLSGVTVDVMKVQQLGHKFNMRMLQAEKELKKLIPDVNINSSKQLREYFIDKLGMPVLKRSFKTNEPSVDSEVLEQYAETNNIARHILDYRKWMKLNSTFIPALTPEKYDLSTMRGKIYPNFNQSATTSGRFSSSEPNMQNFPRKDELGIRQTVVADDGNVLIGLDYSQIELRLLAEITQDTNLLNTFKDDEDIHQKTSLACGVSRYDAKTINFAIVYGIGIRSLSKKLGCSFIDADFYVTRYHKAYPGIKQMWATTQKSVETKGYVETLFGRRRRISKEFHKKTEWEKSGEIRSLNNAIIQGTGADMLKLAMVNMYKPLKKLCASIVACIHDEVLIECPADKADEVYAIVIKTMIDTGKHFTVPIKVEGGIGNTWMEVH